jgi:competence protein ComEA
VVPGWPDDVTLDPAETVPRPDAAPSGPAEPVADDLAHRPPWNAGGAVPRPVGDDLAHRPPWNAGTAVPRPVTDDLGHRPPWNAGGAVPRPVGDDLAHRPPWNADTASRRPIRPPSAFSPGADAGYSYGEPATDDDSADDRPFGGNGAFDADPQSQPGAFDAAPPSRLGAFDAGPRSRLGAFDPGRRGVKALAAVAVIVVLIAAVLAWRARPRVDPVTPPGIDPAAAEASLADDDPAVSAGASGPPGASPAAVVVAVGGKVRKPGLVQLPPGARVADALTAAGGAHPGVDVAPLNLARKVSDGELIMVGVTLPPGAAVTAPAAGSVPGQPAAGPINLNTATLADLDTLPGVGPVLAQRILDARGAQGGFKAVSDLREVEGIGSARYEQLKDLVTV